MVNVNRVEKTKAFFMLCFIALFLIDSFFHIELWTVLMAPIVLVICLMAFPSVKGINKYISSIMLITGIYLLIKSDASLIIWSQAMIKNAGITVLLLSVPLLSIIFYFEDFHSHISSFTSKYVNSDFSFYIFTALIINFFAIILNIASVPLVNKLLEKVSEERPKKVFYRALTRGYCIGQIWAPNFVAVALALQYSGLQWYMFAPIGLVLSALGMLIAFLMEKINLRGQKPLSSKQTVSDPDSKGNDYKSLIRIVSIAAFLILFIIALQYFSGKSVLVIVPFVSIIFPAILALFMKKLKVFKDKFNEYYSTTLPRMNNEIILFTSVGFLGHALNISGTDKYIPLIINSLGIKDPIILVPFIALIIVTLSFIGLHPVLTIATIAIAYSAGALPLSQVQMAATFSIGYFSYTLISPFSGLVLAVASFKEDNPFYVGVSINATFIALFLTLASVVIAMW